MGLRKILLPLTLVLLALPVIGQKAQEAGLPDWKALQAAYDYDKAKPLDMKIEEQESLVAKKWHLTFTGASGEKVPGIFMRPKKEGVYPCILALHGLTRSKEDYTRADFGLPLLQKGFAVLALDAPRHGERKIENENQWNLAVIMQAVREGNRDYRRALDYLATRKDVDMKRVGLLGYSMGAMMGSILGGVEKRISCLALCVGGDPFLALAKNEKGENRLNAAAICPSLYIGHTTPRPVLLLNGKKDQIVREPATKALFEAANDPKEIRWYEAGHELNLMARKEAVEWLAKQLKTGKNAEPAGQP